MTRTALITGATDGIGRALAERIGSRGDRAVRVGRRPLAELDPAEFAEADYCRADLAGPDPASRVERFLSERGIDRLDLLVQNAGVGTYAPDGESAATVRTTLDVNLVAPIELTHALLPHVRRAGGAIVFVSSVLADLPGPDFATYAASKSALDGFARSLRVELGDTVAVILVHPGATRTGMHAKSGLPAERIERTRMPSADEVAQRILAAADRGARDTTFGASNRLARLAGRRLARPLDALLRRSRR